jgi:ABC-type glycerol-3-phosphate transport system permease component
MEEAAMNPTAPTRRRLSTRLFPVLVYGVILGFCVWALVPLLWALTTSFKPTPQIMTFPPQWIPEPATLDQYQRVLFASSMPRYFLNSFVVALITVAVTLAIAAHAAYAVARFDFFGKHVLLFTILATMMIARLANIVPLYILSAELGLLDTRRVLILVYSGWQIPVIVWLLRDFFERISPNLDKAALVDGYSRLGAFYRISLPLARPGLAAAAILIFVYVWNDFIIAVTLTNSSEVRMATVGLYMYVAQFGIQWGELMAAVVLAMFPVVAMFLILQRTFVRGLTAGSING